MMIENTEKRSCSTESDEDVRETVLKRYHFAKLGLKSIFSFLLILNIILSLFADSENKYTPYNRGPNLGGEDFTISHSMTGNYSKPFALFLVFICSLYYTSIAQYQLVIFKCVQKHLTAAQNKKLQRYNQLAYTASNITIILLMSLTIFDARNFPILHLICAILFFIGGYAYSHLMMTVETILIESNILTIRNIYTRIYYWSMVVSFVLLLGFWIAKKVLQHSKKREENWAAYVTLAIFVGAMEYIYVILILLTVTSSNYERKELWNMYDFPELLHTRIFSFADLFHDLIKVISCPFRKEEDS